jgi:hypothetical protein
VLQAPSFRLEQYIQQQQKPSATPSDAASQLNTAIQSLRAALASQQQLFVDMSAACEKYQDAVLSQSLSYPSSTTTAPSGPSRNDQQAAPDPNAAAAAAHSDAAAEAAGQSMQAAAAEGHQPEEVAMLMDAVTAGLQQDLDWMVSRCLQGLMHMAVVNATCPAPCLLQVHKQMHLLLHHTGLHQQQLRNFIL